MKWARRLLPIFWVLGIALIAFSLVGASRVLHSGPADRAANKDAKTSPGQPREPSRSGGLVCLGTVDVESGLGSGIIALWPATFPQPSEVTEILPAAKEGSAVKTGDPLLRFDDRLAKAKVGEAQAAVDRAEAVLAQAEQNLRAHEFSIVGQRFALKAEQAKLRSAEARLKEAKRLAGQSRSNEQEIASAEALVDAQRQAVGVEQTKLHGLEQIRPTTKVDEAKKGVAYYQQLLDQANIGLDAMTLKAPADGVILRSLVTKGLTFGPQSKQPAFWFQPKGELVIRAEVPQEFAHRVRQGQAAIIYDDTNSSITWRGKVARVGNSFLPRRSSAMLPDPFQLNEPRVLECVVTVELGGNAPPLRIGQQVRVNLGVE